MRTRSGLRRKLALLLVLATAAGLCLPWSLRQESSSQNRAPLPALFPSIAQAVADFDGDRLPDRAELVSNGSEKDVRLTFSSGLAPKLRFSSETLRPGSIYAEDIDRDSDEDLIWVSDQQPVHTSLWLNNGAGDLARVSNPAAYGDEIKHLIAGGSRSDPLASFVNGGLRSTATSGFNLLALPDDHLLETPYSTAPKNARHCFADALSPSVSCYHKRGPPSFLS